MNILSVLEDIRQEIKKGKEETCQDVEEYNDIMNSEEARHYGLPAKLQIWINYEYGKPREVEILNTSSEEVTYKCIDNGCIVTTQTKIFLKHYELKGTLY